jgi:thiamine-phosphate pyrophosphorylase
VTRADLREARLYAILDLAYVDDVAVDVTATKLLDGGVDMLQLRAKQRSAADVNRIARDLHALTSTRGVPLIINDYPSIAHEVGAEGVHVGQDDMPAAEARAKIGGNHIVGKSTHSIEQAVSAAAENVDYIGFGPLFATPTKPDYQPIGLRDIAEVERRVAIPVFCIGGIKLDNLAQVIAAGARRVVIVSRLLKASDVAEYARRAKEMLCQS